MGLRPNQSAAALVLSARAYSAPGSHNPWPLLVGAHVAGPISIGDSERRAVRVPWGHVDGTHAKCGNDAGKEHAQRRMSKSDKVIEPQQV